MAQRLTQAARQVGQSLDCRICNNVDASVYARTFHVYPQITDEVKFGSAWTARLWREDQDGNGECVATIRDLPTQGAAEAAVAALLASYEAARFNAAPSWPDESDDDGNRVKVHVVRRVRITD